jgi:hypothetical protein
MAKRKTKRPARQQTRRWDPLQRAVPQPPENYTSKGLTPPDVSYRNDLYSVFVRFIPGEYEGEPISPQDGALHISFHRHDRAAIRDWRHFQAIKNECAGPERTAIEIFPPESQLIDQANEYHLFVLPEGYPLPFLVNVKAVSTQAENEAEHGKSKARQRDWQPGLPTGKGVGT